MAPVILKLGSQRADSISEAQTQHQRVNGLVSPAVLSPNSQKKRKASEISTSNQPAPPPQPNGVHPSSSSAGEDIKPPEAKKRETIEWPEEIPHWKGNYAPIAHLAQRLSQATFRELSEVVRTASDLNHQPGLDPAVATSRKKKALLGFAGRRRNQWIKLAVLQKWADRMPEIYEAVDLRGWLVTQQGLYDHICWSIGHVKKDMVPAMLPAPDIRTAAEVLSQQIPESEHHDFGPPRKMSSKRLLELLREMNILIAIRLKQLNSLPPHLRHYTIHDGRATFKIKHEFDLDLSLGDEDSQSPFFFIDLRLDFRSSFITKLDFEKFKHRIEPQLNFLLAVEGIPSAITFLHDLILTFKLNLLRQEAITLAHGAWKDSLHVSQIQRTLVIQYWASLPGPKSWIEIGINSGKTIRDLTTGNVYQWSRIDIKSYTAGKMDDTTDHLLNLNYLNLEETVQLRLARSLSYSFQALYHELETWPIHKESRLRLDVTINNRDALASKASIQLTQHQAIDLTLGSCQGHVRIQPETPDTKRTESVLNGPIDPQRKLEAIEKLRASFVDPLIDRAAADAGWRLVGNEDPIRRDTLVQISGARGARVRRFQPPGWSSNWVVTLSCDRDGDKWSVHGRVPGDGSMQDNIIPATDAFKGKTHAHEAYTAARLHAAITKICPRIVNFCLQRLLTVKAIQFSFVPPPQDQGPLQNGFRPVVLQTADFLKHLPAGASLGTLPRNFQVQYEYIVRNSMASTFGNAVLYALFRFEYSLQKLLGPNAQQADPHVQICGRTGNVAVSFPVAIGTNPLGTLAMRLQSFDRMLTYLLSLSRFSEVTILSCSMTAISFQYSNDPLLIADIKFDFHKSPPSDCSADPLNVQFSLRPFRLNPHNICLPSINKRLTSPVRRSNLGSEVQMLLKTKTIFVALTKLPKNAFCIHVAELTLVYIDIFRAARLETRLVRNQNKDAEWVFSWCGTVNGGSPELWRAFRTRLSAERGPWKVLGEGITVGMKDVGLVLQRLDEVVRASGPRPMVNGHMESSSLGQGSAADAVGTHPGRAPMQRQDAGGSQAGQTQLNGGMKKEDAIELD